MHTCMASSAILQYSDQILMKTVGAEHGQQQQQQQKKTQEVVIYKLETRPTNSGGIFTTTRGGRPQRAVQWPRVHRSSQSVSLALLEMIAISFFLSFFITPKDIIILLIFVNNLLL